MKFQRLIFGAAIAVLLSACGGGGSGTGNTTGGNSNSTQLNDVNAGVTTVNAGQSTALTAHAVMRGATPSAMTWQVSPLSALSSGSPTPTIADAKCVGASYAPPLVAGASGEGTCQTVITFDPKARAGVWRVTNTASSTGTGGGSVSNFVDITVNPLPESGFRLLESSTPIVGYINKALTLNVPFTINPGADVKNINYVWTAGSTNPAPALIAGARNSSATVTPTTAGQYSWNVFVTADVNGFTQTVSGTVVAIVYSTNTPDIVDAGLPQIVTPGSIVKLTGSVQNKASNVNYIYSWAQLPGTNGGPTALILNNTNSTVASFVAPTTTGNYEFVFSVTKDQSDGTKSITQSQTTVVVQADPAGVFNVSAGSAQTVAVGAVATLTGSVGTQGNANGVTYQYLWKQVGNTPAVVTLSNANTQAASFIPTVAGNYTFNLTVTATTSAGVTTVSGQTTVLASVGGVSSGALFAMTADSGPAQSVAPNTVATLTGKQASQGSTTGVSYAFAWTQQGALPAAVVLSNANTATATFLPTVSGVYTFRLTVTAVLPDGSTQVATSDSQVVVGGVGNAFSVTAGNAQTGAIGAATVMNGTVTTQGSYSGATFTYAWTQVGATPAVVTISNASSLTSSFLPTVSGTYSFMLTVTATQGGATTVESSATQVLVP